MNGKLLSVVIMSTCTLVSCGSLLAENTNKLSQDYPYRPVPFTDVDFSDSFWMSRMETNRTKTIPFAFEQCEDTNRVENFKVAGGLSDKKWDGDFGFNDTDIYKIIEGGSYALMIKEDPQLDKYMDELISYIAAAQEDNGYLYTPWTSRARDYKEHINCCYDKQPWDNLEHSHELYNAGHMYEAAAAHYLATGKKTFLNIAIKNADLVCEVFGPGKNLDVPGHQEVELGLVKLYRATGDIKYLNQAKWFLDRRGKRKGSDYSQQHKPVIEQTEAVGHAVRANYMYSAMADVAAITGDADYLKAIDTIWSNVSDKKLYITGGTGARHSGEAYGSDYELPNRTAYCETCAAIANVYWNHRMFLLHGESKYIDVMERALYNNVLSGVSLDGMKFFYPNPLESAAGNDRSPWFGCACCPSNLCRFMASVPGYVYAIKDDGVYVNLFVDSKASLNIEDNEITVTQKTKYPWEGKIEIVLSPEKPKTFTVYIRIPDWTDDHKTSSALYTFDKPAKGSTVIKVNGQETAHKMYHGYMAINRTWRKGDAVTVDFPMEPRRVLCDERVVQNKGKAAIQRGPLVYCIEWPDVEGGNVLNLMIDKDAPLTTEFEDDLLSGVAIIKGEAKEIRNGENGEVESTTRQFVAIPYYAWAHRGKGPMAVWIPYTKESSTPLPAKTTASQSGVSVSFLTNVGNTNTCFVNDQLIPDRSGDPSKGFLHFWPHKGTVEWVQYDFAEPADVSGSSVYWFDDTGFGECRVPKSWRLLYKDGDEFVPVQNFSDYKVTLDDFDIVSFSPVLTSSLRLEMTFQEGFSGGIQEWIVE